MDQQTKSKEAAEVPGISKETVDKLKSQWGELIHIVGLPANKDETEHVYAIVKSPENDRSICGAIENQIDKNFARAREVAVQNCVVYNKDQVLENNFAFRAASAFIIGLIPNGAATVKN